MRKRRKIRDITEIDVKHENRIEIEILRIMMITGESQT